MNTDIAHITEALMNAMVVCACVRLPDGQVVDIDCSCRCKGDCGRCEDDDRRDN
jgi:hypothetical protein